MKETIQFPVGVIGGGSFGTALANVLGDVGHEVALWVRSPERATEMAELRENRRYHPGLALSDRVHPTSDLGQAVRNKEMVVSVVPSHATRAAMKEIAPLLGPETIVVCATKGLETGTQEFMSEVLEAELQEANRTRTAYLSGPSFAKEIMNHVPTVVSVASKSPEVCRSVQFAFNTKTFRVYTVDDVIGVEVAGAVKNVMAIAAGIADGLDCGYNTRAALITRGLAEISRLGAALDAKQETFMGLAGMGDLVLTCTGDLSRNRTVGLKLGGGQTLEQILAEATQVAEGVNSTKAVYNLAKRENVKMPIVEAVYHILYEGKSAGEAVKELMARPLKAEKD